MPRVRLRHSHNPWIIGISIIAGIASINTKASEFSDLDCVITPSAQVEVSAAAPGMLQEVNVDRSDRVTKGQLLAQLDSGVELAELELAQARAEMDAKIRLGQTNLRYDRRSWRRLAKLHSDNLVSAELKEEAERETNVSRWRLQDAKDLLRQRELERKRAQQVLLRRQVFSPIDGIVVQRLRHPGEYVEEQPILRIAQLDPLYVEAIVPMTEFGLIRKGMRANVFSFINQDQAFPAEVVVVDSVGDAASGTFGVRLTIPNPDNTIPAGVNCRVRMIDDRIAEHQAAPETPGRFKGGKISRILQKNSH